MLVLRLWDCTFTLRMGAQGWTRPCHGNVRYSEFATYRPKTATDGMTAIQVATAVYNSAREFRTASQVPLTSRDVVDLADW
jgi:hypothetical protein